MWLAIHRAFEEWPTSRLCLKQIGVAIVWGERKVTEFQWENKTLGWHLNLRFPLWVRPQRSWRAVCALRAAHWSRERSQPGGEQAASGLLSRGHFSGCGHFCWLNFVVDGFKKYKPQTKTTPFLYRIFHPAFFLVYLLGKWYFLTFVSERGHK